MESLNLTVLSIIVVASSSLLLVLIWGILSVKSLLKERSIIKKFERMKKMARGIWDETDD
tara:strand:+ start:321 stop:500 length:180 start_codon:yes stop_codon:yes gene_type:complete